MTTPTTRRSLRFFLLFLPLLLLMLLCGAMRWIDGAGPYHNSATTADLDADGDTDVLLNNLRHETDTVLWAGTTLWYNQGDGRFTPVDVYNLLDQQAPASSAAADVDRDGDADLVGVTNNRLTLALQQDGRFTPHNGAAPPGYHSQYRSVTPGDLNADGQIDAFVAGCCGMSFPGQNNLSSYDAPTSFVWINHWNPRGWMDFHALPVPALDGLAVRAAAFADLDADGDLDLFAAVQHGIPAHDLGAADRVLRNDGAGNLTDSGQRLNAGDSYSVALGDLDADGDIDALVGTASGAGVWTNHFNEEFVQRHPALPGGQGLAVFLSDLDADGDLDAVVAGKTTAALWFNDGQGQFRRAGQRLRYTQRHALTLADFNNDGAPDLFAAAYAETHTLWLNNGRGVFLLRASR